MFLKKKKKKKKKKQRSFATSTSLQLPHGFVFDNYSTPCLHRSNLLSSQVTQEIHPLHKLIQLAKVKSKDAVLFEVRSTHTHTYTLDLIRSGRFGKVDLEQAYLLLLFILFPFAELGEGFSLHVK